MWQTAAKTAATAVTTVVLYITHVRIVLALDAPEKWRFRYGLDTRTKTVSRIVLPMGKFSVYIQGWAVRHARSADAVSQRAPSTEKEPRRCSLNPGQRQKRSARGNLKQNATQHAGGIPELDIHDTHPKYHVQLQEKKMRLALRPSLSHCCRFCWV